MPQFTTYDVLELLRVADRPLADYTSGNFQFCVAPRMREAQPLASGVYNTIFARNRDVELVIYRSGRIIRQQAREQDATREGKPLKLILVDDVQSPETVAEVREAHANLQERYGIEEILYFTRTHGGQLYMEFIPPRQTAPIADTPAGAQQ